MSQETVQLPDLTHGLCEESIDAFFREYNIWAVLPRAIDLPNGNAAKERAVTMLRSSNVPDVDAFLSPVREKTRAFLSRSGYHSATGHLLQSLRAAAESFEDNKLDLARVHILWLMREVFLASLAVNTKYPKQTSLRDLYADTMHAGIISMKADEVIGAITPVGATTMFNLSGFTRLNSLHQETELLAYGERHEQRTGHYTSPASQGQAYELMMMLLDKTGDFASDTDHLHLE